MIIRGAQRDRAIAEAGPPLSVVALLQRWHSTFWLDRACRGLEGWALEPETVEALLPTLPVFPLWESEDRLYGFVGNPKTPVFFAFIYEDDDLTRIDGSWDELLRYWVAVELSVEERISEVAEALGVPELGAQALKDSENGRWDDLPSTSGTDPSLFVAN